jgi:hypothetical protein
MAQDQELLTALIIRVRRSDPAAFSGWFRRIGILN